MRNQTFQAQKNNFPDIDGLWTSNDLAQSETLIRGRLPANGIPDQTWNTAELELSTQLARALGLLNKIQEAQNILNSIKKVISIDGQPRRARLEIRYLLEQGRIYCLGNTPVHAQACFLQGWTLAQEAKEEFFSIDAAMMLATTQPPKLQSEWLKRAMSIAEGSANVEAKSWLTRLYERNGWDLFEAHKFEEALRNFEKALEGLKSDHKSADRSFEVRWDIGRTLRALKRIELALNIQKELLSELDTYGKTNGYVFLEMAECLQILKSPDEAKKYFGLAHQELSRDDWFVNTQPHELSRIQHLGKNK